MRTFTTTLGGTSVTVVAPEPDGTFAAEDFRATFPAGGFYGLDVEGTYMDDLGQFAPTFGLRLIQFGTADTAWVLNLLDDAQRSAATALLTDETVAFCSHTNMDVLSVATRLGVDLTARNVDTRNLAALAAPDDKKGGKDLKTLATAHIGGELAEADRTLGARFLDLWVAQGGRRNAKRAEIESYGWAHISADDPDYLTYAGLDAIACRRLADALVPLTEAPPALLRVEIWLAAEANRIQLRGMLVDRGALDELTSEARRETSQAEAIVKDTTGGIPARSPKIHDWLAEHGVDWDVWDGAFTDTGKPSLAKDNIKLLLNFPLDDAGRIVAQQLIRFKAHQDALNKTNGIHDHLGPDGRVHPVLNTLGAVTGRMSSSGPNFQNFSKKDPRMRGLFLPEPGHVLLTADFDQVELRVVAALAREKKMVEVILAGGDLHQLTADEIGIPRDLAKMTNFLCVPLDSEILTRRGWLRHDEVKQGDETLGFDQGTGTMRWTEVEAVHRYEDAELVRIGNGQTGWSAICTPDHRWVEERRRFVKGTRQLVRGYVATDQINKESRLLLSAPAETDRLVDLTPAECAVIAWAYADGSVKISELTGRTSQGSDGRRRRVGVWIFQSKEAGLSDIRRVLADVPHTVWVRKPVGKLRPIYEFRISPDAARSIWARAGLLDGCTFVDLVMLMSREQRQAFSSALFAAEGHRSKLGARTISQNAGDFCDAIELAAFLDGNLIRRNAATHKGNAPNYVMAICKPRVTGQKLVTTAAGRAPVWCVTTALGSWVMRQEGRIMLTGNCVYGGGGQALHEQAGIPLDEARRVVSSFRERYPAINDLTQAMAGYRDAIRTISQRRIPVTTNKGGQLRTYANINYLVQSSSRDLLVDAWWRFATEFNRADMVWYPVHDELVLQVPENLVDRVTHEVQRCMRFDFMGVPISASAVTLLDEEGTSRWMTSKRAEAIAKVKASQIYPTLKAAA